MRIPTQPFGMLSRIFGRFWEVPDNYVWFSVQDVALQSPYISKCNDLFIGMLQGGVYKEEISIAVSLQPLTHSL